MRLVEPFVILGFVSGSSFCLLLFNSLYFLWEVLWQTMPLVHPYASLFWSVSLRNRCIG